LGRLVRAFESRLLGSVGVGEWREVGFDGGDDEEMRDEQGG
jgi:hypothetical protein